MNRNIMLVLVMIFVASIPSVYAATNEVIVESPRLVNTLGNPVIEHVNINQQVQITADLTNAKDIQQDFLYIVQISTSKGAIVSLDWITGTLDPNQKFSPAKSWTPKMPGSYQVDIFVWESLENTRALSEANEIFITAS